METPTYYDCIVIGGGITGAGIARDAAMRGLKVAIVEKGSFGGRTTESSSEMIHGGLKYQRDNVELTKWSCLDSGVILNIAPHLLERQIFFIPVLKNDHHGLSAWEIFLRGYDRFQKFKGGKSHTRLSAAVARGLETNLRPDIVGALTFDEWRVNPRELVVANLASAVLHGAKLYEHTRVAKIDARSHSVTLKNRHGDRETIQGMTIVNAAGPWATEVAKLFGGQVKMRLTKGSHIIVRQKLCRYGLVMTAKDDKPIFIMPTKDGTMIGPTNVMFYGDPAQVVASDDEIAYLLEAANYMLNINLTFDDVVRVKSGLRPQLHHWGVNDDHVTHDYAIYNHLREDLGGFFTVIGGKMSMYRKMAQDAVDLVAQWVGKPVRSTTHLERLPQIADLNAFIRYLNTLDASIGIKRFLLENLRITGKTITVPERSLALSGHEAISGVAFRKKAYASLRLLWLAIGQMALQLNPFHKRWTAEKWRRHYDV